MFLTTCSTKTINTNSKKIPNQKVLNTISIVSILFASCNLVFASTPLSTSEISAIEGRIGYSFIDKNRLNHVFHHNSLPGTTQFQQLEWRGDSIVRNIVAEQFYSSDRTVQQLQTYLESKISNANFSEQFRNMGLHLFLRRNSTTDINTVSGDAFEALVAAIHLDSETAAKIFVIKYLNLPIVRTTTAAIQLNQPVVRIIIRDENGATIAEETRSDPKIKTATKQIITKLSQQKSIGGKKQWVSFKTKCREKGWKVSRETKHPAFSTLD